MPEKSVSCRVERLSWDSARFGFEVGRVMGDPPDEESLQEVLERGGKDHFELVYWFTRRDWEPGPTILRSHHGRMVDRKTTFERRLSSAESWPPTNDVAIEDVTRESPSPGILALGVSAGEYSRFRVDRDFPPHLFIDLYRTWTSRSLKGEIADAVLLASLPEARLAGLVTLALENEDVSIGLIAVAASVRGRGVGSALIAAAHRWAVGNRRHLVSVVTQADNAPACGLYRKAGYTVSDVVRVYHFWPQRR